MSNEPAALRGGIAVIVALVVAAAGHFGLDLDPELVTSAVVAVFAIGVWLIRRKAWGPDSHQQAVAYALQLDPTRWREIADSLGVDKHELRRLVGADGEDADDDPLR